MNRNSIGAPRKMGNGASVTYQCKPYHSANESQKISLTLRLPLQSNNDDLMAHIHPRIMARRRIQCNQISSGHCFQHHISNEQCNHTAGKRVQDTKLQRVDKTTPQDRSDRCYKRDAGTECRYRTQVCQPLGGFSKSQSCAQKWRAYRRGCYGMKVCERVSD